MDSEMRVPLGTVEDRSRGNMEPMDFGNDGAPAHRPDSESFEACSGQTNGNRETDGGEVGDPHTPMDTEHSSIGDQEAAQTSPEVPHVEPPMKTPSAAAIPLEELHEACKDVFVRGAGAPSASSRPAVAKIASKELVIKARDAVAATFKAAGLEAIRSSWGRKVDKREALYYLLGWALGRGLLPVTDRPGGAAGELGDKFWVWATDYDKELAAQKKDVGRAKSRVAADKLDAFLADAAEARNNILRTVVDLGLPSPQSAAATARHARPKPEPPVVPSSYREPDFAAELAEAEGEAEEADVLLAAALLKGERLTAKLSQLDEPPANLAEYLAGGRLEDLTKYKLTQPGATFPERERKRREAEVRRYIDLDRRCKAASLEIAGAELESKRAALKVAEARARCSRREEVRVIHDMHHARRARQMHLNGLESRLASAKAAEARGLEEMAGLRVALAAAEAAEAVADAAPVGVPVAQSSATVVEGVLVDGPEPGDEAGEEDGDDGMLL